MGGSARKDKPNRYSLHDFQREFPTDDACLDWLWRHLYSEDGVHAACPKCDRERGFHRIASRKSYSCDTCGHHVHPTAGTIFHKSSTSLRTWFHAIFIMSATRCGTSAKQLQRETGVTYKCAWRMFNRIRKLLAEDGDPLGGEVEIDETFIGGSISNRHRSRDPRRGVRGGAGRPTGADPYKTPVLGFVERGGRLVARVVPNTQADTLMPHVHEHVLPASMIYTDEWSAYNSLSYRGWLHRRVNHAQKVYVDGDVHTNTIEGFWSLVKRGIDGTYHSVSRKWLQDYLNEYSFRYNHRDDHESMFKLLLGNVREDRPAYVPAFPPRRPKLAS